MRHESDRGPFALSLALTGLVGLLWGVLGKLDGMSRNPDSDLALGAMFFAFGLGGSVIASYGRRKGV